MMTPDADSDVDTDIELTKKDGIDDAEPPDVLESRPICGNGLIEEGELCDDGNDITSDSCPSGRFGACVPAFCGDGFVHLGAEECETDVYGARCSSDCLLECFEGLDDCDPEAVGCETNLRHDGDNCGACGFECDTSACNQGICGVVDREYSLYGGVAAWGIMVDDSTMYVHTSFRMGGPEDGYHSAWYARGPKPSPEQPWFEELAFVQDDFPVAIERHDRIVVVGPASVWPDGSLTFIAISRSREDYKEWRTYGVRTYADASDVVELDQLKSAIGHSIGGPDGFAYVVESEGAWRILHAADFWSPAVEIGTHVPAEGERPRRLYVTETDVFVLIGGGENAALHRVIDGQLIDVGVEVSGMRVSDAPSAVAFGHVVLPTLEMVEDVLLWVDVTDDIGHTERIPSGRELDDIVIQSETRMFATYRAEGGDAIYMFDRLASGEWIRRDVPVDWPAWFGTIAADEEYLYILSNYSSEILRLRLPPPSQ